MPFLMEALIRKPTKTTPFVRLDSDEGTYLIAGRSIPIDAELFYRPILNWIDGLQKNPPSRLEFCFRYDFFNIASSKRVLFILYKLAELRAKGTVVSVRWMYERFDEDMLEIGQDYNMMIDELSFTFEEYEFVERESPSAVKLG